MKAYVACFFLWALEISDPLYGKEKKAKTLKKMVSWDEMTM